jgi:hypothetical protein
MDNDIGFSRRVRRHRNVPYTGLLLSYDKSSATAYEMLLMVGLGDEQEDYVTHIIMNEMDEKEKKKRLSMIIITTKRFLKARVPTLSSSAEFRWAFQLEKLIDISAKEGTGEKELLLKASEKKTIGSGDTVVEKKIRVDSADVGRSIVREVKKVINENILKPKEKPQKK